MPTDDLSPLLGHGEDHVTGGARQEVLPPLFQPCLSVLAVACGATAVAAGMGDVVLLTTMLAWPQLSAQGLSPAPEHIIHGSAMAGQEVLAKPLPIVRTIAPQDVRHLWHAHAPARVEIGHEGGDGGVHDIQSRGCQMGVAGGGPRALVAKACLNDAPRHSPLSQRGGVGMAPRVDGGVCSDPTLAHHRFERLLAGGGGQGRRAIPGWEQPGAGPLALPIRPP
jgi:hypothetical protein